MLDSLRGTVLSVDGESAVLESGGFGVRARLPAGAAVSLPVGAEARLYTYLLLRDEQFLLYGFHTEIERDLFAVLLSVSGLGPEKARGLLGALTPADVVRAVADEDSRRFQAVKGVGTRLAQRIAIELKGKLDDFAARVDAGARPAAGAPRGGPVADVAAALCQLGYPRARADAAASAACDANPDASLEDLVKGALRALQKPP